MTYASTTLQGIHQLEIENSCLLSSDTDGVNYTFLSRHSSCINSCTQLTGWV